MAPARNIVTKVRMSATRTAALAALAALAAGLATVSVPAAAQEEKTFDGLYIAAETGFARYNLNGESASGNGLYYGGALGYRKQLGRFVVGVEGHYAGTTIKVDSIFSGPTSVDSTYGGELTLGAVLGENRNFHLFGLIGVSETQLSSGGFSYDNRFLSLGAGMEYRLSDRLHLRAKARLKGVPTGDGMPELLAAVVVPF